MADFDFTSEQRSSRIRTLLSRRQALDRRRVLVRQADARGQAIASCSADLLMNSIAADVQCAVRQLRKSPGYAAFAIGTLALGISANTVIFSGVEAFLLRPLPGPEPERVVLVREMHRKTGAMWSVPYPDFLDWKAGTTAFQHLGAFQIDTFNINGEASEPERIRGSRVTDGFLQSFGLAPAAGRIFIAEEDSRGATPVAVVSLAFAESRYGSAVEAVGRTLRLDGRSYTIAGVMPAEMRFPMGFSEIWIPLGATPADPGRGAHFLLVAGRLKPEASLQDARAQLDAIARQIEATYPNSNKDLGVYVASLSDEIARGPRPALIVLWVAVAFVLLICCANLANLTLARAIHRNREFAIRRAAGAGNWRIIRQLLTESAVLSIAGGAAGLLLAGWGVAALSAAIPAAIQPIGGLRLNATVLAFAFLLSALTGLVFGLAPAMQIVRRPAADALREGGRAAGGPVRNRTASVLVIGEVTLAVMLLAGAGLVLLALQRVLDMDTGFESENVLTAEISPRGEKYNDPAQQVMLFDSVLARLNGTPGVQAAAAVNFPPMTNIVSRQYAIEGRMPEDRPPLAVLRVATPAYATVMRIPIIHGRFFTESDRHNSDPVVVVSERFATMAWNGENAVGKRVALFTGPGKTGSWRTVVGVVRSVRQYGPSALPNPEIYVPFVQLSQASMYLAIRTIDDPIRFAEALRSAVRSVDPDLPVGLVRPMERVIADMLTPARVTTWLLAIFSALALMLAAMGLYGVISYVVARRTHEFGIRLALGSSQAALLRLVLRRSLFLTSAGTILGLLAALAVSRVLTALVQGVRAEPAVFGAVAAILALVAGLASWLPLRRALASGPLQALRSE